jgi:predicted transcriptional regulator
VKRENLVFSVKIFPNIDNINPGIIDDIKSLSLLLKSKPILIGIRNRYQTLEDNKIYIREGLPFVTLNTLENILKREHYPHVLSRRGGGVVYLKGNLMKTLREDHLISRKDLSEKIGVTKRTVCAYENESMRPSENVANKISEILKDKSIFRKINLFEWNFRFDFNEDKKQDDVELNPFEEHLQIILSDIGIGSHWYRKGKIPFKLSLYSKIVDNEGERSVYPLFSGVSEDENKINSKNFECLKMFRGLFNRNALFIINSKIKIPDSLKDKEIPILSIKTLETVDNEEDFIELIQES